MTFVAGFNLANGYDYYGHHYTSGDLFIDINGDGEFGDIHGVGGNHAVVDNYGYDYVFDIDWDTLSYEVYTIDETSTTITAMVSQNQGSSPWQYDAAMNDDELVTSGALTLTEFSRADIDDYFLGGTHYAAGGFDLAFLGDTDFIAHWTMSCGNDNLMGYGATDVPEPDTVALFALGVFGLVYARKTIKHS